MKLSQKIISFFLVCFLFFGILPFQKAMGNTDDPLVFLTEIDGEIKVGTFQYLKRVVDLAEEEKANYLVIKLDTPGGLLQSTRDIADLIIDSQVEIVVFVHKQSGWAYSAGTFILLAADISFVHPNASIGAAEPRTMGDEAMETDPKLVEGMVSWMKSLADRKDRDSQTAERFVRENLTLNGKEAKELKVIDETAESLEEVFLKLGISDPNVKEVFPTLTERFFDFLSHPYLISLFLTLGGLGLIFAFRTGEFELTGILGILLLLLGLWGVGIIQFSIFGILLIVLGLFLLIMEIFQPGFGVFGGLGIISLVLGIFTFEAEPFFSPKFFDAMTMIVFGAIIATGVLFIIIGRGAVKSLKAKPETGSESLINLEAEVVKEINPLGRVKVNEETWQAKSVDDQKILEKSKVKIKKVKGNTLFVEKISN